MSYTSKGSSKEWKLVFDVLPKLFLKIQQIEIELHHLHLQEINLNLECWFIHSQYAGPNFVLNTIVAEVLSEFADRLEKSNNLDENLND